MNTNLYAITPPPDGKFPAGFWDHIRETDTSGDPGWVRKMNRRKMIREQNAVQKTAYQPLPNDFFHVPVLMGNYSDKNTTYNSQDFQNLLFGNNLTGSLTDYYNEVSYGQFTLAGDVFGWFYLDNSQSYYASDNYGINYNFPRNNKGFVYDLVVKADPTVDFSQYDNDGLDGISNSGDDDGYVDAVIAVHTGGGAEFNSITDNLWSVMGDLGNHEYTTNDASANGGYVKVKTFTVCPELLGNGPSINKIGIYAHEFGHVLGLPDLYDRTDDSEEPDYNDSEGIGEWCLMANGCYGGDGQHSEKPSHFSAWCKIQLGWVTPQLISEDINGLTINQVETNQEIYKLWEDGYESSRYFLIENRQKTGFDTYLHESGLLIYHVDEHRWCGKHRWSSGFNNDDETHKLVDFEEADGSADLDYNVNRGDAGDPFPGNTDNRHFNATTNPDSRDYSGQITGVEVNNISNSGYVITCDIKVRDSLGYTISYNENGYSMRWGWSDLRDTWSGVLFTPEETAVLTAVDVGFFTGDCNYEINVFDSFEYSIPKTLLATVSGYAPDAGWYTIEIPEQTIVMKSNQDFFVSVKVENISYGITYDAYGTVSGRSYYSTNGNTFYSFGDGDISIRSRMNTTNFGALTGRITESLTGVGIENATVTVTPGDYMTNTDNDGYYTISMILSGNNYTVTATKDFYVPQSHDITITSGVSSTVDMTLVHMNRSPVIVSIPDTAVNENETFFLQVDATDPDGDVMFYSLVSSPEEMSISGTGLITWTPDYTQSGEYTVTMKVEDGNGGETTETFSLTVNNTNRKPVITTTGFMNATQDIAYADTISAEDSDEGDLITYELLNFPEWLSIDHKGVLSGIPNNDSVGEDIPISIMAEDTGGLSDTLSTTINVINVLDPPLNFIVEDVPNDNGHRLQLRWDVSPDDEKGYVSWYRIYRSRSDELTEPISLTHFTSIDSLTVWEEHYTILMDSLAVGETEYIDECVPLNGVQYYYWLQSVGSDIVSEKVAADILTIVEDVPTEFNLYAPYPNPFNPKTTIEYSLPQGGNIILTIYNASGQAVSMLKNEYQPAGYHSITWNATGKPSGLYFCTLKMNGFTDTRKMVLVK